MIGRSRRISAGGAVAGVVVVAWLMMELRCSFVIPQSRDVSEVPHDLGVGLTATAIRGAQAKTSSSDVPEVPWEPSPRHLLHFATFHKGGSTMAFSLFVRPMKRPEFADKTNTTVVNLKGLDRSLHQIACETSSRNNKAVLRPHEVVAFEAHNHLECGVCRLRYELLEASCGTSVRAIVVLRDPRDMLLSATAYHQHAAEEWLNQTAIGGEARGKSYRQSLLDALVAGGHRAAVLHEMLPPPGHVNVMHYVIRNMVDYVDLYEQRRAAGDHRIILLRYEDLVQRTSPIAKQEVERTVLHLHGARRAELVMDLFQEELGKDFSGDIARHGRGANASGWREVFDEELHRTYRAVFGNAAERLGYPSW